ncbi:MAG: TonB-dependent receptor plug domain-containing protein [Woeseiaceae bacterium]
MKRKIAWLMSASLIVPVQVIAQDVVGEISSDDIVVYGTRLPQPETEAGSSVVLITADDIEALGVDFIVDAIATAPGVTVTQSGSFGGFASVRIRGAASEQTLVIIDGVAVNDPSSPGGGFDFSRLDPANVDRIEILKGPQSTLWGTDAIGGVVNIVTKRPADGFGGNAFAQGGSFGAFRGGAAVNGANDRYDFRLSATGSTIDGISKADEKNGNVEKDGYESATVSAVGGLNLPAAARLQASLLWTDADLDFDSFSFGAQGNVGDGDESSETEELTANLTLQLPLFDGKLDNLLLVGIADIERENFSNGLPAFQSEGERTTFRYQGDLALNEQNRMVFGAEREETETGDDDTSIDGLFALYEIQPFESLTLTAGLRRDDHARFGAETTGRLAVAYNPHEQLTLSASWGEGFKAPTLFQTTFFCCGGIEPNPNLRPEVSDAFDVGVTIRTADDRGELGLTYFDQDTTDLITFSFGNGTYENIAAANSSGYEVMAGFHFSEWASVTANYTNIDAMDQSGARLPRVPEHSGNVVLSISPRGSLSGTVSLRYNGSEEDANGDVSPWTRVDVAGRYRLNEQIELYGRVENMFDQDYQQVLGYGTPGVSGHVGAQFRF